MKPETIQFNKPVTIIQAYHHHYDYHKDQRRFEERKDEAAWQKRFASFSGYVADGELYLPESIMHAEGFKQATHIILNDFQNPDHSNFRNHTTNHCLNLQNALVAYDDFKFKVLVDDGIDVHLYWSFMGYFDPQQYKIAELYSNSVIEIRRNRVANATLTGRKERTYTEAFTILQHLGTFRQASLLRPPIAPVAKLLPQPTKVIDLMKHLY